MSTFKTRCERFEKALNEKNGFRSLDFSKMTDEELQQLSQKLTRDSLRLRLGREPINQEVDEEIAQRRAYLDSLPLERLVSLKRECALRLRWQK
jgi:hypothetical protein